MSISCRHIGVIQKTAGKYSAKAILCAKVWHFTFLFIIIFTFVMFSRENIDGMKSLWLEDYI